jgi:hypothetical protein
MLVIITAIQMGGLQTHEAIAAVKWLNPQTPEAKQRTKAQMVSWLRANSTNRAIVLEGTTQIEVGVVDGSPPYVRTHADGKWTNNLLAPLRF